MAADTEQTEFSVLDTLPMALVVFQADGRIVWSNTQARENLGQAENLADALDACTADTRFDDWHKVLSELSGARGSIRFLNINCRATDSRSKLINLTLAALGGPSAEPERFLALLEDVSRFAQLERELAHSERLAALGKFSAEVAHELNNPLDGILRYVNLAIRLCQSLEDERPGKYLLQARRGLMRMVRIITELLEFSRTSDAALVEDCIDHIIEEALNALEARAGEASVKFQRQFAPNLPFIRTGSLFQVFCNLICNAIEAMPDGGMLTITAELSGPDVRISLADVGVGLPDGETERIFEPFFTTKPAGQGTGLGLAICREVIEKYQGTISAADRPSGGAIITVTIPLSSCQTAADLHLPRVLPPPQAD
ncbi:MAG: GHKL domain-containing protein [Phycisphaerae bacterium]|nr:GHKL domain-containing protein [Phycisphaerae bacterium]